MGRVDDGVGAVGIAVAAIAGAEAAAQAAQLAALHAVVEPGRGHQARRVERRFAEVAVVALAHLDVVQRVLGDQVEAGQQFLAGFQLKAARADFAGLDREIAIDRVGCRHVLLGQVEKSGGKQALAAGRLEFDADFVLLAARRRECLAVTVAAALRQEGGAVAGVRRQAVGKNVIGADTPAHRLVALFAAAAGEVVVAALPDAVVAQAGAQAPGAERHLVLGVDAELLQVFSFVCVATC